MAKKQEPSFEENLQALENIVRQMEGGELSLAELMLQLGLSVGGCRVTDYKADGVIVSTATGSTAYSLSAGGPIVNPKVQALLITPICPHTFNVRPMIIAEDDEVRVHIAAVHQDILLTFDGQESFRLLPGDEVIVHRASKPARIVKFEDKNYYHTLKNKLWRNG